MIKVAANLRCYRQERVQMADVTLRKSVFDVCCRAARPEAKGSVAIALPRPPVKLDKDGRLARVGSSSRWL